MSKKRKVKEIEKKEVLVYIGPTIQNVVAKNTFFKNGPPEHLKEEIAKEPALSNLIVPISRLADAMKEIANKKGSTYLFYKKIEGRAKK